MPKLVSALIVGAVLLLSGGTVAAQQPAAAAPPAVDLALVLAVDVSGSMDEGEAKLQRDGYLRALVDPKVVSAIQNGPHQAIAVTYVEWSGPSWHKVVAGWHVIRDAATAMAFVSTIAEEPVETERRTSISGAIDFAAGLLDRSPYPATRRVIDISGDGPNNRGRPVTVARDEAVARGITINGLPIVNDHPNPWGGPPPQDLDVYYQNNVSGGPGAFVMPAHGLDNFAQAILAKLVREIAGTTPKARVVPVKAGGE